MSFKKTYILLFIISILGLAIIQYQYLRIGLNLAGVQFNEKIGLAVNDIKDGLQLENDLTFLLGKALTKDDSYFKLSIDSVQDASRYFFNDFLKDKLLQQGIKTNFTYTLYGIDSDYYLKSPNSFENEDNLLKFPIIIEGYLPSLIKKKLVLELQFKNLNKYFLSQLNGLTIPSLIFLIIIVFIIIWVLRSFYWQRKVITTTNEFINNLTHELKTPVFSIGLATKILEEKNDTSNSEVISLIRIQIEKLKIQIDKVLELANLENKKEILQMHVFDFNPIIKNIASEYHQLAKLENINFESSITNEPYLVKGEPSHLENTIKNILENAKKYSTENPSISLKSYKKNGKLFILIKDNGIGISKENIRKIFDKYYRVSSGDIHNVKGYGLGLHYVKKIVKLHKGKIEVISKPNEGAEFIIILDLID